MGLWSFYFIIKAILFYTGYINFHFFVNVVFALALIFSHTNPYLLKIRRWISIPIGLALFYFDSQLPPLRNVIPKVSQLTDFSYQYYLELLTRIVNWEVLAALLASFCNLLSGIKKNTDEHNCSASNCEHPLTI